MTSIRLTLPLADGGEIQVRIRTLRVGDYPAAFGAWEKEDEARLLVLVGLPAGDPPAGGQAPTGDLPGQWPASLSQEGYESAVNALYQANPGFFAYCVRRATTRGLRAGIGVGRNGSSGGSTSPAWPQTPV